MISLSDQAQGAGSLQNYNSDLVRCLQDVRQKRDAVHKAICREETKLAQIQQEMCSMQEHLERLANSIEYKRQSRIDYDKTIGETESAYMKILESSQTLLHVLKRETQNLSKRA